MWFTAYKVQTGLTTANQTVSQIFNRPRQSVEDDLSARGRHMQSLVSYNHEPPKQPSNKAQLLAQLHKLQAFSTHQLQIITALQQYSDLDKYSDILNSLQYGYSKVQTKILHLQHQLQSRKSQTQIVERVMNKCQAYI